MGDMERIRRQLKELLRSYTRMNSSIKKHLEEMGFTVVQGRKHYKLYYKNDMSHSYAISATSSDRRAGANASACIYRKLIVPYMKKKG